MISRSDFKLDEKKREILPSYSQDFPFSCLDVSLDNFIGRGWHWHPALEIDYCTDGELEFSLFDGRSILLRKGEAVFINSNVLHAAKASQINSQGRIYAFLFGEEFISGSFGNIMYEKYMLPLYRNPNIPYLLIHPTIPIHVKMIGLLLKLPELAEAEEYGYEFEIRDVLCRIWMLLLKETEKLSGEKTLPKSLEETERLKKMIQFIHEQYMNKISLSDISYAAGISERECNRCFKKNVQITPIEYLNNFRIRMAAQMLLHTDQSISLISDFCGFQSNSYFGKVFRNRTGKTPFEYRKTLSAASRQVQTRLHSL